MGSAGVAGVLVVLTGWLPSADARQVALSRGAPVLGFLVAITVLAELADRAGVFDAAAGACARLARGSTLRLFGLVAVLGTATTIGMSLDTTAVLLTPVVLTVTDRLGLRPLPFALLAVWLANTTSLLLPVSNLTNLLALQREHLSTPAFASRMALPELAALVVTVGYLAVVFRRDLTGQRLAAAAARRPAGGAAARRAGGAGAGCGESGRLARCARIVAMLVAMVALVHLWCDFPAGHGHSQLPQWTCRD